MQVVLKKAVRKLGHEWDVVKVKDGFGRNHLIPKGLALPATEELLRKAKKHQEKRLKHMDELMGNAKDTAKKLEELTLTFAGKAHDGKLYGSIGEKDVVEKLKEHKMELPKEAISMKEHFKTLGEHVVTIELAGGVKAKVKVVIGEEK